MNNKIEIRGSVAVIFVPYQGRILECLVDAEDLPKIEALHNSVSAQWRGPHQTFYCYIHQKIDGKQSNVYIHRLIAGFPEGLDVDHWDHDGLNNRKYNLRSTTRTKNLLNRRGAMSTNRTSGIRGVYLDKRTSRWYVRMGLHGKGIHVGTYATKELAAIAAKSYQEAHVR